MKELRLDASTLIFFFTSDNGPHGGESRIHKPAFFRSAGPLRGGKRDLYEGGIRVPMIAHWPGKIPAGRSSNQIWAFWDILPTLADAAGAAKPDGIDGISFLPTLLGHRQADQHPYLYWDYGHTRGNFSQAVRAGDWKAIRNGPAANIELYNLRLDIGESKNIAADNPQIVAQAEAMMREAYVPSSDYPIRVDK